MKAYLSIGTAAALILLGALPAQAQYQYRAKSGDADMLNGAQRIDDQRPVQRMSEADTMTRTERVTRIEPAAGNQDPFDDFTGFYGGADIGYSMGSYEISDPAGPDGDVGIDGFNGGLFLGYGMSQNFINWLGGYLGLELGYTWTEADGDLAGTSYDKDDEFLATLRPGITMHQDAMGYGIIGYSMAKFETGDDDERLNGLVLGAGAEFDTNTPFKTRLEYTYTNYEDEDIGGIGFDGHENNIKIGALMRF